MQKKRTCFAAAFFYALAGITLWSLISCGGGGGGSGSPPSSNTPSSYSISGTITSSGTGLQGVTVTLSSSNAAAATNDKVSAKAATEASSATATTDASGNFSFTTLANGNYIITPSKSGSTFIPINSTQTVNGANIHGVNFINNIGNWPIEPNAYVRTEVGGLPVVISVPHGGSLDIPGVPVRTAGPTGIDLYTVELAAAIQHALQARTGQRAYLVAGLASRKYVDFNRSAAQAYETAAAAPVYQAYHTALQSAVNVARIQSSTRALLIDLLGQSNNVHVVYRGTQNGRTANLQALYAAGEFFSTMQSRGIDVDPAGVGGTENSSYNGGYIVGTYGLGSAGVNAVQLAFGMDYRNPRSALDDTANKVAEALAAHLQLPNNVEYFTKGGLTLKTRVATSGNIKTVTVTDPEGKTVLTLNISTSTATIIFPETPIPTIIYFQPPLLELPTDYTAKRMAMITAGPIYAARKITTSVNKPIYSNRDAPPILKDSPGCDWVYDMPCNLSCCAVHDECYNNNACDFRSWAMNIGSYTTDCSRCNSVAMNCIVRACGGIDKYITANNCYDWRCGKRYDCPPTYSSCDCKDICVQSGITVPRTCGNGKCDSGENTLNCPGDCTYCGNGKCDSGETPSNCPSDCGGCGTGPYECIPGGSMHYEPCLGGGVRECMSNCQWGPCLTFTSTSTTTTVNPTTTTTSVNTTTSVGPITSVGSTTSVPPGSNPFRGSLSGRWSGTCPSFGGASVSGSFTMNIDSNGAVTGAYSGSQSGSINGNVSSSGTFFAGGGGAGGGVSWTGNFSLNGTTLRGSGLWSDPDCNGAWSGP